MALVNLATLWKPKKKTGALVLVGDSKDKQHTYMVFEKHSKDGVWTMYDLCERFDEDSSHKSETDTDESGESEEGMPF